MPIQELMDQFVPLSGVLIVCSSIPEILVELSISKARDLTPEVRGNFKHRHETNQVRQEDRKVESCEDFNNWSLSNYFNEWRQMLFINDKSYDLHTLR